MAARVPSSRLSRRYDPAEYGLPENSMLINDISMGFIAEWSTNSVSDLNSVLPLPMAVVGDYISVSTSDTSLPQYQKNLPDLLNQWPRPVYMATIMPEDGSYSFDSTQADAVSYAMNYLNSQGFTVWVRFMYEMNGCPAWNPWGCDPVGFKQAWAVMAKSLRAHAPDSYMLWNPNIDANGTGNYASYYPSDSTVDLIGLDLYWFGFDQHLNTAPPVGWLEQMVAPFYDVFVAPKNKPFILGETGAAFHYVLDTSTPVSGGSTNYYIKTQWFDQTFGTSTQQRFPLFIAAVYFNYEKDEVRNGTEQTVDYRVLLGEQDVEDAVWNLVS